MNVLENGDYQKDDGTIITREEVVRLHLEAKKPVLTDKKELKEGACTGPILLTD